MSEGQERMVQQQVEGSKDTSKEKEILDAVLSYIERSYRYVSEEKKLVPDGEKIGVSIRNFLSDKSLREMFVPLTDNPIAPFEENWTPHIILQRAGETEVKLVVNFVRSMEDATTKGAVDLTDENQGRYASGHSLVTEVDPKKYALANITSLQEVE